MNIYINPILGGFIVAFFIIIFNVVYLFGVEKGRKWTLKLLEEFIKKELKEKK